jgi:hypothetical protein
MLNHEGHRGDYWCVFPCSPVGDAYRLLVLGKVCEFLTEFAASYAERRPHASYIGAVSMRCWNSDVFLHAATCPTATAGHGVIIA